MTSAVRLCLGCAVGQRCRLGISAERIVSAGRIEMDVACPAEHEGGPGVAHGGWTASVFDELFGHLFLLEEELVVTAELAVSFTRPVSVGEPLIAWACVDRIEGSRRYVSGHLRLAGGAQAVLGRGTAVMVHRDPEHFVRHVEWQRSQYMTGESQAIR